MARTLRRKAWYLAGIFFAGLLVMMLSLPLLVGVFRPPPPPDTPGLYRPSKDPRLPYEQTPGWQGMLAGAYASINSLGFRGSGLSTAGAAGETRVAVVGDSVVFGQGLPDDNTIPAMLAREFSGQGRKAEAINAGVRGYSAAQYPALTEKVLALKPDLVILVITLVNDPEKEQWKPSSPALTAMGQAWWARLPGAKIFLGPRYAAEINRLWLAHVRQLYDPRGPYWLPFLDNLRQVRDLCASAGAPLLVVVFPMPGDPGLFAREEGQLEQALNEAGFEWLSVRAALDSLPPKDQVVSRDDFHPGPAAADAAAKVIAERAAKMLR